MVNICSLLWRLCTANSGIEFIADYKNAKNRQHWDTNTDKMSVAEYKNASGSHQDILGSILC